MLEKKNGTIVGFLAFSPYVLAIGSDTFRKIFVSGRSWYFCIDKRIYWDKLLLIGTVINI